MKLSGTKITQVFIQGDKSFEIADVCTGFTIENLTTNKQIDDALTLDPNIDETQFIVNMGVNDNNAVVPLNPESFRTFYAPNDTYFVDTKIHLKTGINKVLVTMYHIQIMEHE